MMRRSSQFAAISRYFGRVMRAAGEGAAGTSRECAQLGRESNPADPQVSPPPAPKTNHGAGIPTSNHDHDADQAPARI